MLINEIESFLRTSLEDGFLSKEEKKDLKAIIGTRRLTGEQYDSLIGQVNELAKGKLTDAKSQFVLDWVHQTTAALASASEGSSEAYFSPGETCRNAIINQLATAVSTIRIAVFTISDDRIVNALIAAHRKGRKIRILTDNDKSLDRGSDILQLQRAGVSVRMDTTTAHMHHKFMVIDDRILLTGSYNWTSTAASVNYENIIVTDDEKLVKSFMREFERLWTGTAF